MSDGYIRKSSRMTNALLSENHGETCRANRGLWFLVVVAVRPHDIDPATSQLAGARIPNDNPQPAGMLAPGDYRLAFLGEAGRCEQVCFVLRLRQAGEEEEAADPPTKP
jgi:hypothetical protein